MGHRHIHWSRALAASAFLLLAACDSRERPRVVVVGIDGASWDLIDPMLERGELPNFQRLIDRGVRGRLIALPPLSSPIVWTTIATGTFPRSHEILGFTYPYDGSRGRPVSSALRRDPAIWNVASANDRSVGVVGWFVTHPPEHVRGVLVSDRAHQDAFTDTVYPPRRNADVRATSLIPRKTRQALLDRFFSWDYEVEDADDPSSPYHAVTGVVRGRVTDAMFRDEKYKRISYELVREDADFFACYFRLVDHASHAVWAYFEPEAFDNPPAPSDVALLEDVIPEAYRWMDEMLGGLIERCGEDVNLVVVSDHGFGAGSSEAEVTLDSDVMTGDHRIDGMFLAAGPDFRQGEVAGLTTIDLAPTLLALTGLPISAELPGRLGSEALRSGYLDEHPPQFVPEYDLTWTMDVGTVPEAAEEAALETLESLGYIESGDGVGVDAPKVELDFWSIDRSYREGALTGELLFHSLREDRERARELMDLIRVNDPTAVNRLRKRVEGVLGAVGSFYDVPTEIPSGSSQRTPRR